MVVNSEFVTEQQLNSVLTNIEQAFPTFVGGVFVDKDGFLMAERKKALGGHVDMNMVGLAAVADRKIHGISEHLDGYQQVKRDLGGAHLFVLLDKQPQQNLPLFNELRKILKHAAVKL